MKMKKIKLKILKYKKKSFNNQKELQNKFTCKELNKRRIVYFKILKKVRKISIMTSKM